MKTIKFLAVILTVGLLTNSCEKRIFTFSPLVVQEIPFPVINDGSAFNESTVITYNNIITLLSDFLDDLDPNTKIYIEAIAVNLKSNAGNMASGVMVSSYIEEGSGQTDLFSDFNPSFTEDAGNYTAIGNLNASGVNKFKNKLEGYINGSDVDPFTIGMYGTPAPLGNNVNITITLKITFSVPYNECIEVPGFMEGGDPC